MSPVQDARRRRDQPGRRLVRRPRARRRAAGENEQLRRQLDAARSAGRGGARARPAELERARGRSLDLPSIDDCDGVDRRGRSAQGAGNFTRTLAARQGQRSGIAQSTCRSWSSRRHGAALVGRVVSRRRTSRSSSVDRRPQLRRRRAARAGRQGSARTGTASGQRDSNLLALLGDRRQSAPVDALKKGDVAVTLGGVDESVSRRASSIGTVVRKVGGRRRDRARRRAATGRRPRRAHLREGAPVPAGADPVIRRIRLGLVVIVCVVLQTTLFTHLRIDGVAPRHRARRACWRSPTRTAPDTGAIFGFLMGLADRPVPHHPARPLGARRSRSPGTRSACSRPAWCAPRRGWRRSSAGVGGLFGGLVFITVGRGRGPARVPVVRQPADRAHRRDLRRGDRAAGVPGRAPGRPPRRAPGSVAGPR